MAQRESGYVRIERDAYMTPGWCTKVAVRELLGPRFKPGMKILEPAVGAGRMALALRDEGFDVVTSDIHPQIDSPDFVADFLDRSQDFGDFDAIWTNPPYKLADAFIRRALELTFERRGMVAMLLGVKHDSGKTRADIFNDCPAWGMKITLLDRIWWFDPELDGNGKINGPSEDHAWYIWDWRGSLGRSMRYASAPAEVHAELRRKKSLLLEAA